MLFVILTVLAEVYFYTQRREMIKQAKEVLVDSVIFYIGRNFQIKQYCNCNTTIDQVFKDTYEVFAFSLWQMLSMSGKIVLHMVEYGHIYSHV